LSGLDRNGNGVAIIRIEPEGTSNDLAGKVGEKKRHRAEKARISGDMRRKGEE
jgi:hypothetical protein